MQTIINNLLCVFYLESHHVLSTWQSRGVYVFNFLAYFFFINDWNEFFFPLIHNAFFRIFKQWRVGMIFVL